MHVSCSCCLEALSASDDLNCIPCGHVFHTCCLLQWFETGKQNCPQCRATCRSNQLRRVFLAESAEVSSSVDAQSLQCKVDSLTFNLRCAETDKKKLQTERDDFCAKNVALKEEFRESERKKQEVQDQLNDLKTQIRYFQAEKTKCRQAKEEADELREKLKLFENVEAVVKGSLPEVNMRLHDMGDFSQAARDLSIIIQAMKKEMIAGREEREGLRRELRDRGRKVAELKATLAVQSRELKETYQANKSLHDDLKYAETEKTSLRSKLELLQTALDSPSGVGSGIMRLIRESPAPAPSPMTPPPPAATSSSQVLEKKKTDGDDGSSPYLQTKSNGLLGLKRLGSPCKTVTNSLSQYNIMKKTRLVEPQAPSLSKSKSCFVSLEEQYFDGLGGHSKPDTFPTRDFKAKPVLVGKKPKGVSRPSGATKQSTVNMATIQKYFSFEGV